LAAVTGRRITADCCIQDERAACTTGATFTTRTTSNERLVDPDCVALSGQTARGESLTIKADKTRELSPMAMGN
jgi:hypothetical protein